MALLSDIHSNLVALEAVLAHAAEHGFDALWVTGDIVGYGPEPDAVVERLRAMDALCVMGNHDAAACGLAPLKDFNPLAAAAASWTARQISDDTRTYLAGLPRVRREGRFTLVHGSLRNPLWEYLSTREAVSAHLDLQETRYSIVGHTHVPLVVQRGEDGLEAFQPDEAVECELGDLLQVINPGSAGQPRDGDNRVAYALLETEAPTACFYRVPYDIAATQARMRELGLPEPLAARLSAGR
ncbi:MAG TPA: metallophosphoesterase family protein [Tepidiformaceae bacterium]|nr:metallophosphoesterase family protein [Tepidiformaceae bacterium]